MIVVIFTTANYVSITYMRIYTGEHKKRHVGTKYVKQTTGLIFSSKLKTMHSHLENCCLEFQKY